MAYNNAQSMEKIYETDFGIELGKIIFEIQQESFRLMKNWTVYQNLFDANQERYDIMNAASGSFFFETVRETLFTSTIMRAGRLTDPIRSAGQNNLTIQRLPALADPKFKVRLDELVDTALQAYAPLKPWRHKKFAHNDLDEKLMTGTNLPELKTSDVQHAIEAIMAPVDYLNLKIRNTQRVNGFIKQGRTELDVLYLLDLGLRADRQPYPDWLRLDLRDKRE